MANSVPSLSNYNYHMFEPSPIETSLAASVDNPATPSAFPLLMAYRAQNQQGNSDYQANIDTMHQIQQQEGANQQDIARRNAFTTALKDITTPGQLQVAKQLGVLPSGIDDTQLSGDLQTSMSAKNIGEAGRGLGAAAMGGFTGLAPAAQQTMGPGVEQGPAAIVQAAQIKEAGANARHNSPGAAGGMMHYSVAGQPDENGIAPTVSGKGAPGMIPGLVANARGMFPRTGATTDAGSNALPNTAPGVKQAQMHAVPYIEQTLKAQNPQGYSDVKQGMMVNGGMPLIAQVGGAMHVIGKSGQPY